MRYLRALMLLVAATTAMVSLASTPASAAERYHAEAGSGITYWEGVQSGTIPNQFDIPGVGNVKCAEAAFLGAYMGQTSTHLLAAPSYTKCSMAGQPTVTVATNGCTYTLTEPVQTTDADNYAVPTHITCPASQSIKIMLGAECTILIGAQTPGKNTVDMTDITAGTKDITMKATIEEMSYTTSPAKGTSCGEAGKAKYTGEMTIKAFKNTGYTEQIGMWIV